MTTIRPSTPVPTAAGVPVRVLRGRDEVGRVLDRAGDLLAATGAPVCAQPLWLKTWYEAFGGAEPVALVAGSGVEIDGLACLAVGGRGPLRTVVLGGAGPSDYGRLPVRDGATAAALAGGIVDLLGRLKPAWRLRLEQLPVGDPVVTALLAALPQAYTVDGQGCPQLGFGPDRALESLVSGRARRGTRQARERVGRAGLMLSMDRVTEAARVRRLLPEVVALKRRRDHDLGRRSDLDDARRRAFYAAIATRHAAGGGTEVFTLRLNGTLAAYFLGLHDGPVFRSWDGRISSDWPSLSLGRLLRTDLVGRLLADERVERIDWCRGELQHKMYLANGVVPAVTLRAESTAAVRTALEGASRLRRAVRRRVPDELLRRLRGRATGPGTAAGSTPADPP